MSHAAHNRARWPAGVALATALLMGATACGDDPFAFDWTDTPDTVLLYSLARPELNLVSGFNFFQGVRVQVEAPAATGQWDAAVDTRDGQIVLLVPGAFGVASAARIAPLEAMSLDDVTTAPSDTTLYISDEPVPMVAGNIYVVKTNRARGSFGSTCVYYAKMEPLEADPVAGTLRFRYVRNPVCNSRDLVPPN
jgi:hypothetical protein